MKKILKDFLELSEEYKGVSLTGECNDSDNLIHLYKLGKERWLSLYQETHIGDGETELSQIHLNEGMVEKLLSFLEKNN